MSRSRADNTDLAGQLSVSNWNVGSWCWRRPIVHCVSGFGWNLLDLLLRRNHTPSTYVNNSSAMHTRLYLATGHDFQLPNFSIIFAAVRCFHNPHSIPCSWSCDTVDYCNSGICPIGLSLLPLNGSRNEYSRQRPVMMSQKMQYSLYNNKLHCVSKKFPPLNSL